MTLPVMITGSLSVRGLDFWKVASLSILSIIPPVILALILSRYLVRGLTMGAIKEYKNLTAYSLILKQLGTYHFM